MRLEKGAQLTARGEHASSPNDPADLADGRRMLSRLQERLDDPYPYSDKRDREHKRQPKRERASEEAATAVDDRGDTGNFRTIESSRGPP